MATTRDPLLVPGDSPQHLDPISDIKEAMFAQGDGGGGGGGGSGVDSRLSAPGNHHHQSAATDWEPNTEDSSFSSSSTGRGRQHCPPARTRGSLTWDWTPAGVERSQACPGRRDLAAAVGTARWMCGDDGTWLTESPSLSDCRSSQLARVEATMLSSGSGRTDLSAIQALNLTQEMQVALAATAIADGGFFGGDILLVGRLLKDMSHRLTMPSPSISPTAGDDSWAGQLLKALVQMASSLLDTDQSAGWLDLSPMVRARAASSLMTGLAASAAAATIETKAAAPHTLAARRNLRPGASLSRLGFSDEVDWLDEAPWLRVPASEKLHNVALIFILWDGLERLLPTTTTITALAPGQHIMVLSSKIFTIAAAAGGSPDISSIHPSELVTPVELTWRHPLPASAHARMTCLAWELAADEWSSPMSSGCHVTLSNATHTTCLCRRYGHLALFMEDTAEGAGYVDYEDDDNGLADAGTIMGIVLAVVGGLCLAITAGCLIVHRRMAAGGSLVAAKPLVGGLNRLLGGGAAHLASLRVGKRGGQKKGGEDEEDEDGEDGFYPNLNTSPTSTTLSSGTPTTSTTVSNYFLSDCQVKLDLFEICIVRQKTVKNLNVN